MKQCRFQQHHNLKTDSERFLFTGYILSLRFAEIYVLKEMTFSGAGAGSLSSLSEQPQTKESTKIVATINLR